MSKNHTFLRILITGSHNLHDMSFIRFMKSTLTNSLAKKCDLGVQDIQKNKNKDLTEYFDRDIFCWLRPNRSSNLNGMLIPYDEYQRQKSFFKNWIMHMIELREVSESKETELMKHFYCDKIDGCIQMINSDTHDAMYHTIQKITAVEEYLPKDVPLVLVNIPSSRTTISTEILKKQTGLDIFNANDQSQLAMKNVIISLLQKIEKQNYFEILKQEQVIDNIIML